MLRNTPRQALLIALAVGVLLGLFSFSADGRFGGRGIELLGNLASPWGLAAFFVGRRAVEPKLGALTGGMALSAGVATYYALGASAGYVISGGNAVWTVLALVVGPILGVAGAASVSGSGTALVTAIATPSAMLLAEAGFLLTDRRVWLWNLELEPHRVIDLTVLVGLGVLAFVLPRFLGNDRFSIRRVYPLILAGGLIGGVGFVVLARTLVRATDIIRGS